MSGGTSILRLEFSVSSSPTLSITCSILLSIATVVVALLVVPLSTSSVLLSSFFLLTVSTVFMEGTCCCSEYVICCWDIGIVGCMLFCGITCWLEFALQLVEVAWHSNFEPVIVVAEIASFVEVVDIAALLVVCVVAVVVELLVGFEIETLSFGDLIDLCLIVELILDFVVAYFDLAVEFVETLVD
ncbi:hypothetical protein AGLY_012913 [Aphis glycines]|uniref:Uncharacterized protein n=1 Tax=Aphis glycines TaxID=307491 RepID=A0A6G0T8I9_APHGL|nr:hypothetical protein AGLY_012913 [Aphis glycines]